MLAAPGLSHELCYSRKGCMMLQVRRFNVTSLPKQVDKFEWERMSVTADPWGCPRAREHREKPQEARAPGDSLLRVHRIMSS